MSVFADFQLEWKGRTFVVPSNRVMGAIARIEEVVTLEELNRFAERKTAPLARLAMAYAEVLTYAGCQVTADEVYGNLFEENNSETVMAAILGLCTLMVPPKHMQVPVGKQEGKAVATAAKSSTKRTKRR